MGEHVWNIIGCSINLAKDQVLVRAGHFLGQLGVDGVELFAVLALGGEHKQDGVLLDLVLDMRKHFDKYNIHTKTKPHIFIICFWHFT